MNINTDTASKWMGQPEAVHSSTYKKDYEEGDVNLINKRTTKKLGY